MQALVVIDLQGDPTIDSATAPGGRKVTDSAELLEVHASVMHCYRQVLDAVKDAISDARSRRWPVFLVEDLRVNVGTHLALRQALSGYPAVLVTKGGEDGSTGVADAVREYGFKVRRFAVCGAMTGVCVRATVAGLRRIYGRDAVEVIAEACFPAPWEE